MIRRSQRLSGLTVGMLLTSGLLLGQDSDIPEIPPIKIPRAEESYQFLDGQDPGLLWLQPLKYMKLGERDGYHLTLGGGYRSRLEHTTNLSYTTEDETYYSQRLSLHAALRLGKQLRFYTELYHGLTTGEDRLFQDDDLDLHQAFMEILLIDGQSSDLSMRLGRQEIAYGVSRVVGLREGPNMRRSFDLAQLTYKMQARSVNLVYGKELVYGFEAFDNESNFFEDDAPNPTLWGMYVRDNVLGRIGHLDFYYLQFRTDGAQFNDVQGAERRSSLGVRSYGKMGRFSFNTEFIYQFGTLADSEISAFNLETDWKYGFQSSLDPQLGLRLDVSSGDTEANDGKIQTFNPLFVNPAIYSLAAVNTPANLVSLHPNFSLSPFEGLSVYLEYAVFFRTSKRDGLYSPPRFLLRPAGGMEDRHIGNVIGFQVTYEMNRNLSMDIRSSYFITGSYIQASGESNNILFIAPTVDFKF